MIDPTFEVRAIANVDDIDILLNKISKHDNFVYQYSEETLNLLKNNFKLVDSLYLLVLKEGNFVAFVSCDRDWWESNSFFIREIFIDPKFQGLGIGSYLFERCISHAKTHNAKQIVTQTAFDNIPMQKLCEKFGFKPWENPRWNEGITYKLHLPQQ